MTATPKVSIGLPVYNGERYLSEALESLVSQTFEDLEIIVVDNCSTDRTAEIARSFASRDPRVRYVRNPRNIGAAGNFKRAFHLSKGMYFKWMAHDDVCLPDFVRHCVEVLDARPDVVLAYPSPLDIDENGSVIGPRDAGLDFTKETPFERFRDQMIKGHAAVVLFGLIRSRVLGRTALHGRYPGSDRILLAELALYGKFHELPKQTFLHREHADRGYHAHKSPQQAIAFFDPGRSGRLPFTMWRRLGGYLGAATRAPIGPGQRLRCYVQMGRWSVRGWRPLADEILSGARALGRRAIGAVSGAHRPSQLDDV